MMFHEQPLTVNLGSEGTNTDKDGSKVANFCQMFDIDHLDIMDVQNLHLCETLPAFRRQKCIVVKCIKRCELIFNISIPKTFVTLQINLAFFKLKSCLNAILTIKRFWSPVDRKDPSRILQELYLCF